MNAHKQMCWCFKVFFGVFGNLSARFFTCLTFNCYKTCACGKVNTDEHQPEGGEQTTIANESSEEFYKEVGRETAEILLQNKQNGTFLVRPSLKNSDLGTLSVVQDNKMFHLRIRRRRGDGFVALGSEKIDEKCFRDMNALINYYVSNYLVLYSNGDKTLTLLLPYRGG